ncbi:sugar ABC transporter, ATP-binding protein [Oceanicola granulosus HTCC2516]|uniref:Sugar ABC transporter, ATP-binding protein n=1 Tax=Oceanicola granulosus (strain ATCC BAA-861 / DSM 15982 / KCTC 12143 / HTCC2516) TaxID=314256 RepID=Q2CGM6_OCEGH|nr:ABC transporter ATP-binding protein [Oceanicola granulosus]EAR51909.1 sugar ABC transporter, ATP-binding protein [Oceanicola granulosus HTCC2516]
MSELTLTKVSKQFGGFRAVEDIDLTVAPDEVLCLLGPSGCGKTTTLRMIAGLESVSHGSVAFGGRDLSALPAQDRNVAMAFQFYALYPDLTVEENLVFPLAAEGLDARERQARLDHVASVLQLGGVLQRRPHELSEGEKQRVAVGRCIIRRPNAFLFDEPLSRLDVALREDMRGSIRRILATLNRPTVIVTHDQLEAMTMGDRIAVMRDGGIEQVGTPQDVFDYPDNTFVAGFIGTPQMTLLDGTCLGADDGGIVIGTDHARWTVPHAHFHRRPCKGDRLTFGFRPRAASLEAGALGLDGCRLVLSEHMGAEKLLHFDWHGQAVRVLTQSRAPEVDALRRVGVDLRALHVFDGDGRRLSVKGIPQ